MGFASWLADKSANSTRAVVAKAVLQRIGQSGLDSPSLDRANALSVVLSLRQKTHRAHHKPGLEMVEVLPFSFLAADEASSAWAEYIVYKEQPESADKKLLNSYVAAGLEKLLEDCSWTVKSKALLAVVVEEGFMPWTLFIRADQVDQLREQCNEAKRILLD